MKRPNPELIDDENPEWTEDDFARAVPFSGLPLELQSLLSQQKLERKETVSPPSRQSAA